MSVHRIQDIIGLVVAKVATTAWFVMLIVIMLSQLMENVFVDMVGMVLVAGVEEVIVVVVGGLLDVEVVFVVMLEEVFVVMVEVAFVVRKEMCLWV